MSQQLTAIIYTTTPQVNGQQFLKYRNITNTPAAVDRFLKFASKFPGARHVNFYDKATRKFVRREYINEGCR